MLNTLRGTHRGTTTSNRLTMLTKHLKFKKYHLNLRWKTMHLSLPTLNGTLPIPSQIYQLATVLHNILLTDRDSNAAILEKLENPQEDLNASPIQVFTAGDLAHLASHLATTSQTLAQHAQNLEMEDLSEIDD